MKRIPMAMKKATSQRRTKTTLIDVKPTWLPFFFDRELGMNSPRSLVVHVNYTFLSHSPNSNGEGCSSLQEGAVGPQHNYSSFSFCQHSYHIWTSHDWVGRLFFKLMLARSFNCPKHIIIFSVLRTHNLREAHIQRLGYLWYIKVPFASQNCMPCLRQRGHWKATPCSWAYPRIGHIREYPPGHTGCRIQRSRSVRVRLDWLQSLSYSKICERVRYRTRSQTCVLSKWETARSRSTKA